MLWHWFPSLLIQKTIPPHRWEDYYRVVLHHTRCLLHTIAWWTCENRRWYKLISLKLNLFGKKRKYNRGSGNQKFLVFGMVERGTKKWFYNWSIKGIQISPYQSLINMLKRGLLISLHTSHLQTKATAILPSTTIEGLWSLAKLKIKKWRVFYIPSKLQCIFDEFMYRYRYGHENGDVYRRLLHDVGYMTLAKLPTDFIQWLHYT